MGLIRMSAVFEILSVVTPIIQIILSIVAISSIYVEPLNQLASHGKTRVSVRKDEQHAVKRSTERLIKTNKDRISQFIHYIIHDDFFQIRKKRFIDFYVFGLVWLGLIRYFNAYISFSSMKQEIPGNRQMFKNEDIVTILLSVHFCRRIYECKYIHEWDHTRKREMSILRNNTNDTNINNNKNGSTMHIMGWLLGLIHYFLLPFSAFCFPKEEKDNAATTIRIGSMSTITACLIIAFNLYSQYEQYCHHRILGECRKERLVKEDDRNAFGYSIPHGRFFRYISCPHYTAEITIYLSLTLLLDHQCESIIDSNLSSVDQLSSEDIMMMSILNWCHSYKHWVLFGWVFINLTVSARNSHRFYHLRFAERYPADRHAIIPFIY